MPILSAAHVLTCKGRASYSEARPLMICHFGGDKSVLTPTQLQQQYLTMRHGLRPAFAVVAAELIFGGEA